MSYSLLKILRKDPQAFHKLLLLCLIAHVVIIAFILVQKTVRSPKRMAPVTFATSRGIKLHLPNGQKKVGNGSVIQKKIKTVEPRKIAEVKKNPPVEAKPTQKNVETKPVKQVQKKEVLKKDIKPAQASVKKGATSKLALPEPKKVVEPKKVQEPIKIEKKETTAAIKKVEPEIQKMVDAKIEPKKIEPVIQTPQPEPDPEFQNMVIGSPEIGDVPGWFEAVCTDITEQISSFKLLKDIEEPFVYSALLTINAQGIATISEETGCTIPVIRATIKKIYLGYQYPKTMWNKIWPIRIEQ